jgi:uncharacterized membrane protein
MAEHPEWVTRFLIDVDLDAIVAAVAAAERQTSGQIRVHLERRSVGDPIAHATHIFHRLGMHRTRHRNGVLLLLTPGDRKFALIGDRGIHDRVGHGFWDSVRDVLQEELRAGRTREGVIAAVAEIGRVLGAHFPDRPEDTNELPDRVSLG